MYTQLFSLEKYNNNFERDRRFSREINPSELDKKFKYYVEIKKKPVYANGLYTL